MDSVKYVSGQLSANNFPKKFSNQIFFSENSRLNYSYKSIYSIKYQITGNENYLIEDNFNQIDPSKYLVVNNKQNVTCIESQTGKAFSIFIEPKLLSDVYFACRKSMEELLANPYNEITDEILFFEEVYKLEDNRLGELLKAISKSFDIYRNNTDLFSTSFFYEAAKALLISQQETLSQIKRIESVNKSTKNELYKRVSIAKEYIIDNWNKELKLESIAKKAFLSTYHFHRTFTSVYKIPPLKFHKMIRMQRSKELLETNRFSVSEIAIKCGYENIHSFSKAFKKFYNTAPANFSKTLN